MKTRSLGKPILVFSNGKSATTSLVQSLGEYSNRPIYQLHTLNQEKIRSRLAGRQAGNHRLPSTLQNSIVLQANPFYLKKADIITVVRDPLASSVSSFFQNIQRKEPTLYQQCLESSDPRPLIEKYNHGISKIETAYLSWFDEEYQSRFSYDVYETAFDKEQGYQIHQMENNRLLLMKLERLQDTIQQAMKSFLGVENFVFQSSNIGSKKEYHELYKRFLESRIFTDQVLDSVYRHKYVQHFYTDQEIDSFRAKWQR